MGNQQKVDVDPKELEEAQEFWDFFMKASKYCIVAVIIVLILMALTLL